MAYIINASFNYADEFDYPVVSIMSNTTQFICANYPKFYKDADFEECYFGTNEFLSFDVSDIQDLFQDATYIQDEQLPDVKRFLTSASYDIAGRVLNYIFETQSQQFVDDLDLLSVEEFTSKYAELLI